MWWHFHVKNDKLLGCSHISFLFSFPAESSGVNSCKTVCSRQRTWNTGTQEIILEVLLKAATAAFALCCCWLYSFWTSLKQWWIEAAWSADNIEYVSKKHKAFFVNGIVSGSYHLLIMTILRKCVKQLFHALYILSEVPMR